MVKNVLQGKQLRHPLHPFLVHFPIGLFTLSFVLDLVSLFYPLDGLYRAAFYAIILGVVCSLTAAIPGFADFLDIREDHPAKLKARWHAGLNVLMVVVFAVDAWIRSRDLFVLKTPIVPLLLSSFGILLLSVSGYLGGSMIYDDGIAVGRHRRRTRTPDRTLGIAIPPERREHDAPLLVPVADADSIGEGESIRADVGGTVIAVVKLDGKFYAFQEFCTHRFGPLSEGELSNGHVQCPWHRSCFDVRTGKVLHGPAKVDLKTYPVRVENGKVVIEVGPSRVAGAGKTAPQKEQLAHGR
jgi:nitrite reductase/ring-hydroxylating ferredoxin subunit/uncharacterized membrane protein